MTTSHRNGAGVGVRPVLDRLTLVHAFAQLAHLLRLLRDDLTRGSFERFLDRETRCKLPRAALAIDDLETLDKLGTTGEGQTRVGKLDRRRLALCSGRPRLLGDALGMSAPA